MGMGKEPPRGPLSISGKLKNTVYIIEKHYLQQNIKNYESYFPNIPITLTINDSLITDKISCVINFGIISKEQR